MQINRLLEIVYVLLRHKVVTAKELAERFGVSRRTIYRDIDHLSIAGIPVYTEKGKGGGISLLPDFVLNKSILSESEQTAILTALQGLSSVQSAEAGQVLNKLSSIFNKNLTRWLEVDFTDWSCADGGFFDEFKTAILEHLVAEFEYYSSYGEKTRRRVEPMQLWFKSKAWYLKAFCLIRQDMRLFKLTRIKNMVLTGERFPTRDLLAANNEESASARIERDVTLKLLIAPEMAHRVFDEFAEDMVEKQPDGAYLVTVTWPEAEWLYGSLLSYGDFIEVLEPEYMREIIKNKLLKAADKYL